MSTSDKVEELDVLETEFGYASQCLFEVSSHFVADGVQLKS